MISQFPGIDKEINDISLPLIGLYFLFIEVGVGWGWGLLMTINAKNTGGGGLIPSTPNLNPCKIIYINT